MNKLIEIKKEIRSLSDPVRAKHSLRFFKTGKGEYGEGDKFLGLTVPEQRTIAKKYRDLPFQDTLKLLKSEYHEHRLVALFILIHKFEKGDKSIRKRVYDLYLKNTKYINNWDLVDSSAHKIVGEYLTDKDRSILYKLAKSKDLWEKRISIISTFAFIRDDDFKEALALAEILRDDEHDLIHRAVGWVLREVGKKDLAVEERFLKKHYKHMPRTMLRYAIERFPEKKRKAYLYGTVKL